MVNYIFLKPEQKKQVVDPNALYVNFGNNKER